MFPSFEQYAKTSLGIDVNGPAAVFDGKHTYTVKEIRDIYYAGAQSREEELRRLQNRVSDLQNLLATKMVLNINLPQPVPWLRRLFSK